MSTWLVPRSELTPDQIRTIERNISEHRVIFGGPGSGKTQVLLHRARHLIDQHGVKPTDLRIFVYTSVLKEYITSALKVLGIPDECVSTFDAWCMQYHKEKIGSVPWDHGPDTEKTREAVGKLIAQNPSRHRRFAAVLVDEGQDLDVRCFEILRAITGHITACVDHKQQIYDRGSGESELLTTLGLKRRNAVLLETYRCSPYVVQLASRLIVDSAERAAYVNQTRVSAEKETPLLYLAGGFDDERRRLVEIIKARQDRGERIAILLPQNRQVAGFAKGLMEEGLEVEVREKKFGQNPAASLDFNSDLPKLLTYHSAKGLTFDAVLMPRLVPASFGKLPQVENLLFVGITRASKWVYLSTDASKTLPAVEHLINFANDGILTVQSQSEHRNGFNVPAMKSRNDDILDIL